MGMEKLEEMHDNMKELEEIKADGLVVLKPLSSGDIISVDTEASLDGMNIVDFTMTMEKLVEIAVERLDKMEENMKIMEEIKEDGLVVLEPQSAGDIISIDSEANLDGMNIVEFENAKV
eukprot:GFUD01131341.1.p1 GENE.GFUD01131341.1~~GFUD01131341.1.p1  ORF type:complete len:131 (+),score=53.67 GFUD01131341.1:37-393(+)